MSLKVLIVDDVADLRILVRLSLRQTEFEVVAEAPDGAEAVLAAQRCQPDLVLLDLSMPVMDGLEALPRIKQVAPASRVVVLSGFEAERMGPLAQSVGAAGYLEKGLSPPQLLAELRKIVSRPLATGLSCEEGKTMPISRPAPASATDVPAGGTSPRARVG